MTPAERLARGLDSGKSDEGVDGQMHEDAAALIRRLAAALVEFHAAYKAGGWATDGIEERHAEALRDIKEET